MGHKGKSIRKLPKEKAKPFAGAKAGTAVVSIGPPSGGPAVVLPAKTGANPVGPDGRIPTAESKKRHKNR